MFVKLFAGRVRPVATTLLICLAALVAACEKPEQVSAGAELNPGGVAITVTDHEVVHVDVETERGAQSLRNPALRIDLQVTNNSGAPLQWNTGFGFSALTQTSGVLLFAASSFEEELGQQNNIASLQIADPYPADPIQEATVIEAGATVNDVLLFAQPPAGTTSLLLSFPPHLLGPESKLPGYIQLPYSAPEEDVAPGIAAEGELFEGDRFSLGVQGASVAYAQLIDPALEDDDEAEVRGGITRNAVLRLEVQVTNTGEEPATYEPVTGNARVHLPVVQAEGDGTQVSSLVRVETTSNAYVEGQVQEPTELAPGDSLTDVLLFEKPPAGLDAGVLQFAGARLGRTGMARVRFSFENTVPERPAPFDEEED